jgi:hypothetical protein
MPDYSLMQHQVEGVKFIDDHDGIAALLYDPGVGKTGTTLSWIDLMASRQGEFRVLVVAPLAAADTWVLQAPPFMDSMVKARMLQGSTLDILNKISAARDWKSVPPAKIGVNHVGKHLNQRVTILSISAGAISSYCRTTDDASARVKTVRVLRAVRKYAPHLIVVDESHIIKGADANISKALYQMGQLVPHRIILTGTVNPLSPLDCYGQWRFLAPWTFSDFNDEPFVKSPLTMTRKQAASIRPWKWTRFKDRYTLKGGFKGKGFGGMNPDYENDLRDRVSERAHVVRKKDALDLPPVTDVDVHVQLTKKEMDAYEMMAEELLLQLDSGELLEAPNALAKMMKLRQIAAGFVKDTETNEVHIIGNSLRKQVQEVAQVTLAGEQRLVVFAYFRYECELLAKELAKDKSARVELITGSTKAADRLAVRQRFGDVSGNPERTILVAQQRTMSLSVNELVTAQHAIYASPSERRVDWQQSRDRLDRKGQKLPVTFWNCFTPELIGDIMVKRHLDRGDMEEALLNHIRSFGR